MHVSLMELNGVNGADRLASIRLANNFLTLLAMTQGTVGTCQAIPLAVKKQTALLHTTT